jgi:hypothetical protein
MTEDTKSSIYPCGGTPRYVANRYNRDNRPPWTTINHQQHDIELCAIAQGSNNQRFCVEKYRILREKYERHTKMYIDGSKKEEEVKYAIVSEEQRIKRKIHSQNSIDSTEQSAIINAIYNTWKKEGPKVIITELLSTMIAVLDRKRT